MLVAFDADVLSLLLHPSAAPPNDPVTGVPVERALERLEYLVAELERQKARVVIATPALSEFLVIADEAGPDYLSKIDADAVFKIEPFDAKAAVEAAALTRAALHEGDKKSGASGTWQAVKADRQIVAIAKTVGVSRLEGLDADPDVDVNRSEQ